MRRIETVVLPCQDGSQIEAEAIDVHLVYPIAQQVGDHLQHAGMIEIEGVAGACVVDVVARLVGQQSIVRCIVDAAERQCRTALVAFGRMVVDDIEDDLEAGVVQACDHLLELREHEGRNGGIARIGREETDRVIAPVICQALFQQMPIVDECVDRQQLNRSDAERADVIDYLLAAETRERAPHLLRHRGVQFRQASHMRFVQNGAGPRHLRPTVSTPGERRIYHTAFRHEARIVAAIQGQISIPCTNRVAEQRVVPPQCADIRLGVGIQQELVRVEAMAVARVIRSMYPVSVDGAGPRLRQITVPHFIGVLGQLNPFQLSAAGIVEQTKLDLGGIRREQREVDAQPIPSRAAGVGRALADTRLADGGWHDRSPSATHRCGCWLFHSRQLLVRW